MHTLHAVLVIRRDPDGGYLARVVYYNDQGEEMGADAAVKVESIQDPDELLN